jgi:hypothetical protein
MATPERRPPVDRCSYDGGVAPSDIEERSIRTAIAEYDKLAQLGQAPRISYVVHMWRKPNQAR